MDLKASWLSGRIYSGFVVICYVPNEWLWNLKYTFKDMWWLIDDLCKYFYFLCLYVCYALYMFVYIHACIFIKGCFRNIYVIHFFFFGFTPGIILCFGCCMFILDSLVLGSLLTENLANTFVCWGWYPSILHNIWGFMPFPNNILG